MSSSLVDDHSVRFSSLDRYGFEVLNTSRTKSADISLLTDCQAAVAADEGSVEDFALP